VRTDKFREISRGAKSVSRVRARARAKARARAAFLRVLKNIALSLCVFILLCITFVALTFYTNIGFFKNLRELYVETAMTTMNHQYLAKMFISQKEIDRIMGKTAAFEQSQKDKTDASVVKPAADEIKNESNDEQQEEIKEIEIIDISETTYKGKLMIVRDPSRVKLAVTNKFLKCGQKLGELISGENAISGINASGFTDPEGKGNGGVPVGIVIKDGKILYSDKSSVFPIIGFNYDNVLILGRYKKNEIEGLKLRDAVSFSPFLIVNGKPQISKGNGGWGIQPRTAIGQTIDGKVLLLVIDGRQVSSIGATIKDIQDIMLEHGAYNAANLDGGSSTVMYHEGKLLNSPCSKYGERYLPNAFVVK
jgi:exopolysaccharide biosynthesis protein